MSVTVNVCRSTHIIKYSLVCTDVSIINFYTVLYKCGMTRATFEKSFGTPSAWTSDATMSAS